MIAKKFEIRNWRLVLYTEINFRHAAFIEPVYPCGTNDLKTVVSTARPTNLVKIDFREFYKYFLQHVILRQNLFAIRLLYENWIF